MTSRDPEGATVGYPSDSLASCVPSDLLRRLGVLHHRETGWEDSLDSFWKP